ncbi:hypothetical protein GFM44_23335 [Rhizobium leguminosarum bv. viciae]|nr:hypothetical protein [Rhizobium leguminosarum bv. viciae]
MAQIAPKSFGPLLVKTGDVYRDIVIPVTIEAYIDADTVECNAAGRIVKANTLFTAYYRTARLGAWNWEDLVGCPLVKESVDLYLEAMGYVGNLNWAPMDAQKPGRLEFRMKPELVASIFPEVVQAPTPLAA